MILSVSRRTDIPAFYSSWFIKRLREGFVYVPNPRNTHQISQVMLSPEVVDCIVFWSKSPQPLLSHLEALYPYPYYIQFTLTAYGRDIEPNLPDKELLLKVFQEFSNKIGKLRMVWRYDPILFSPNYTLDYHRKNFEQLAKCLKGFTNTCIISFVDSYHKNIRNLKSLQMQTLESTLQQNLALEMQHIAKENGMELQACAEALQDVGISSAQCIDKNRIEKMIGAPLKVKKDPNQRKTCNCIASVDIGQYNTCPHGCLYCYANYNLQRVQENWDQHQENNPMLTGCLGPEDRVSLKKAVSLVDRQLKFNS